MSQKIIGLDLGAHEVKVAILNGGFRGFSIRQIVAAPVPTEIEDQEDASLTDRIGVSLERLIEQDPTIFRADGIYTAVPGSLVSTHIVTLPFVDTRRIEQTLPFQLEDQLPFDIEDIVFDSQILAQTDGKSEVLVGVVQRKTLEELLEMLAGVGIDPQVVTLSALAFQNLFSHGIVKPLSNEIAGEGSGRVENTGPEDFSSVEDAKDVGAADNSDEPTKVEASPAPPPESERTALFAEAILDVGHLSTDLCILENGVARYARSFRIAGNGMTMAIASSEQISFDEAQEIKHRAMEIVKEDGDRAQRVARALERGIAPLVRALRQTLFAYRSQTRRKIQRLYITGGTTRLPGMDRHLARELDCEVMPLDSMPKHVESTLSTEERDNNSMGQAIALALRGQGGSKIARINFRKGKFTYKGDLSRLKGIIPRIALIGVLVLLLLGTNVMVRFQALSAEENRVRDQLCEITERVLGTCTTFPDDAVSRLRGQRAAASIVPTVSSADILAEIVRRLTNVDGIEITELDVGGSRVRLQGEAESFDSVARVVSELRGYNCFREVTQGQTRQARQSQKIEFNVDAVLAAQCES